VTILEPSRSRTIDEVLQWAVEPLDQPRLRGDQSLVEGAELTPFLDKEFTRLDDARAAFRTVEERQRRDKIAPPQRPIEQLASWAEELREFGMGWPIPERFPDAVRSVTFDGMAVSEDSLLASEALLALEFGAVLDPSERRPRREVVAAIRPGWGTFIRALKSRRPSTTCVLIDRPNRLMFAAAHLLTVFPESRAEMCSARGSTARAEDVEALDFLFLSDAGATLPEPVRPDLTVQLAAGLEGFDLDLGACSRTLFDRGCRFLYTLSDPTSLPDERWTAQADEIARYYWPYAVPFARGPHLRFAEVLQGRREPFAWKNQARRTGIFLRHVIWWRRAVVR
jgi:hypothetical protein